MSNLSSSYADALQDMRSRFDVDFGLLAKIARRSPTTIYEWSNDGNGGPRWNELQAWSHEAGRKLPSDAVLHLFSCLHVDSSIQVIDTTPLRDADRDLNGDGRVDRDDKVIGWAKVAETATNRLAKVATRKHATRDELLEAMHGLDEVTRLVSILRDMVRGELNNNGQTPMRVAR